MVFLTFFPIAAIGNDVSSAVKVETTKKRAVYLWYYLYSDSLVFIMFQGEALIMCFALAFKKNSKAVR